MATALMGSPAAGQGEWPSRRFGHDDLGRAQRFVTGKRRRGLRSSPGDAAPAQDSCQDISPDERERLLLAHLPQVRSIAFRVGGRLPQHVAGEDLYHAGVVGLIEAVDHYDPRKNSRFPAYAQFRIRGAMLDSLREADWGSRLLRRRERQLERETARLHEELGRPPDDLEAARSMRMSIGEYRRLTADLRCLRLESLGEKGTGDGPKLAEPRAGGHDPFELCLRAEIGAIVAAATGEMDERERRVLGLYYGEELTMKEVGRALGVGESRVCQLHGAALDKVRAHLGNRKTAGQGNEMVRARGKARQIRSRSE
ncbi:MAG TPA: RNA polymerase sigma factor FliA [Patescibacteria group bacterium]|nr:RNA polymerase sigma factor FliA [Patescibacteria group bacterium]